MQQSHPESQLLTYPYRLGALYQILTSPKHPATILLPPGVGLAVPPVLNTNSDEGGEWDIPKGTLARETEDAQVSLTFRPVRAGLETTTPLLMTTGQVLLLRLKSQERPGDLLVTWQFPPQPRKAPGGALVPAATVQIDAPPPAINLERLHTRYLIERGSQPTAWVPVEAYDDGSLTVIRFAEALHYTRAPQLVRLTLDRKRPLPLEYTAYRVPGEPQKGEFFIARGIHGRLRLLDSTGASVDVIRIEETAYALE